MAAAFPCRRPGTFIRSGTPDRPRYHRPPMSPLIVTLSSVTVARAMVPPNARGLFRGILLTPDLPISYNDGGEPRATRRARENPLYLQSITHTVPSITLFARILPPSEPTELHRRSISNRSSLLSLLAHNGFLAALHSSTCFANNKIIIRIILLA